MAGRFGEYARAYAHAARLEYLKAEIPALFVAMLLGITTLSDLGNVYIPEGILVFFLLYFSGFLVNTLTDTDVDELYKTDVADASRVLGQKALKILVASHVGISLVLTLHLAIVLDFLPLFPIVAVGVFFGIGYSLEPFQFKVKGWLQTMAFIFGLFFVPAVFLFVVFAQGVLTTSFIVLALGFSIAHTGIGLVNQVLDTPEDRKMGLMTPGPRWGLSRSLAMAQVFIIVGVAILFAGFMLHIAERDLFAAQANAVGVPALAIGIPLILAVVVGAYSYPFRGVKGLHRISMEKKEDEAIAEMREIVDYPKYQAMGFIGLLVGCLIIFMTTLGS